MVKWNVKHSAIVIVVIDLYLGWYAMMVWYLGWYVGKFKQDEQRERKPQYLQTSIDVPS